MVLDDDGNAEGTFGFINPDGITARPFLWLNQFDRAAYPHFELQEIWVLFPTGPNMAAGNAVELVVYLDPDANPANGASLLATFNETIQVVDDVTFSTYPLATPVQVTEPGDVLIGVVSRFVTNGVTSVTRPAALDTAPSQMRSWVAVWSGNPPGPPALPPDQSIQLVDSTFPGGGNFLIRGFGQQLPVTEVPALDATGLALLAFLLACAGLVLGSRRRRQG